MKPEKAALRDIIRQKISLVEPAERERRCQLLTQRVVAHPAWATAQKIGLFGSRQDEVDTSFFWLKKQGRAFLYPKIHGDVIEFHHVQNLDDLETSRWQIAEPRHKKPGVPDLLLVPGIAFNSNGNRLGRGKGYYDRYLAAHPEVISLGIAFDFQIFPEIPMEPHDRPVGAVVTDLRTFP